MVGKTEETHVFPIVRKKNGTFKKKTHKKSTPSYLKKQQYIKTPSYLISLWGRGRALKIPLKRGIFRDPFLRSGILGVKVRHWRPRSSLTLTLKMPIKLVMGDGSHSEPSPQVFAFGVSGQSPEPVTERRGASPLCVLAYINLFFFFCMCPSHFEITKKN